MSDEASTMMARVSWRRSLKGRALALLRRAGLFAASARSQWRQERLLVLCYHGVAVDDEHLWDPNIYVTTDFLHRRLEILREEGCTVLPLGDALDRLQEQRLPPRSVVLTFDDGMQDFYARAWPVVRAVS